MPPDYPRKNRPYQNNNNPQNRPNQQGGNNRIGGGGAHYAANNHDRQEQQKQGFKPSWITVGLDQEGVTWINEFAKELVEKELTTSQFRNIFGEVRMIQSKEDRKQRVQRVSLLVPKIAYAWARSKSNKRDGSFPDDFKVKLDESLKLVLSAQGDQFDKTFNNFVDFLEAVLAYHKAYSEDNKKPSNINV
ncbi:MAG: type III-A CRISPR-associated protein Csm2 [Phycisphaerales bacterium]|nr:type III-A CRISPR-associated protein Csm2 [Phycisphaerales bacterium]